MTHSSTPRGVLLGPNEHGDFPLGKLTIDRPDRRPALKAKLVGREMQKHCANQAAGIATSAENGQRLDALAGRLRRLADWAEEAHRAVQQLEHEAFQARAGTRTEHDTGVAA